MGFNSGFKGLTDRQKSSCSFANHEGTWRNGDNAPYTLNIGTKCRWVVLLHTGSFTPGERSPVPSEYGAGRAPETVWKIWRRKKSFDPQNAVVQPTAYRYSNWAAPSFRRPTIGKKQTIVWCVSAAVVNLSTNLGQYLWSASNSVMLSFLRLLRRTRDDWVKCNNCTSERAKKNSCAFINGIYPELYIETQSVPRSKHTPARL